MKAFIASAILVSFGASNVASAFTVSGNDKKIPQLKKLNFTGNREKIDSRSAGHEEITRQAINLARQELDAQGIKPETLGLNDIFADLEPSKTNPNGYTTNNPIIKGNYCKDMPEGCEGWADIHRRIDPTAKDITALDYSEHFQFAHALVDGRLAETADGQKTACQYTKEFIKMDLESAAKYWEAAIPLEKKAREAKAALDAAEARKAGIVEIARLRRASQEAMDNVKKVKNLSMFFIGQATHSTQDRFSPLHSRYDTTDATNYDLRNVCHYGSDIAKALEGKGLGDTGCYHFDPTQAGQGLRALEGDGIWIRTKNQYERTKREWGADTTACIDAQELWNGKSNDKAEIVYEDTNQYRINKRHFFEREDQKQGCLKHEARLAKVATAKLLVLMARYFNERRAGQKADPGYARLNEMVNSQLFEGSINVAVIPNKMREGIYRCRNVQQKTVIHPNPVDREMLQDAATRASGIWESTKSMFSGWFKSTETATARGTASGGFGSGKGM